MKKPEILDSYPLWIVILANISMLAVYVAGAYIMLVFLIAMIYPVFSWFAVNPFLYGKLACILCKQGSICCPALKFFIKEKGGNTDE